MVNGRASSKVSLTEEHLKDLKDVFDALDKDGTGGIDAEEFRAAMRSLGLDPSLAEVQSIIKEIDPNGDGHIDFAEFLELMTAEPPKSSADPHQELLAAFRVFDRDGSGSISSAELREVLVTRGQRYTDAEIEEMIKHADLDGNGSIDYQEFALLMSSK